MAGQEIGEIVPRLLQLARSLADQPDSLKQQLDQLLAVPADLAHRVESAVTDGVQRARKPLEDALTQANAAKDAAQSQLDEATQRAQDATQAAQENVTQQLQRADQLEAAAERAHEQALGLVEAASDAAAATRKRADDALEAAKDQAQTLRKDANDAFDAAKNQLDAAVSAATDALAAAVDAAQDAADNLAHEAAAIETRVRGEVEQRLAQAQAVPGQIEALADDARARLAEALEFPAGILSLCAQALCWLKGEFFAQEERLQVVRYSPAADTHGLGLSWTDAGATLLVAYAADHPTEKGSLTIKLDGGADNVRLEAPGVSITVSGAGEQAVVIGAGGAPPAPGNDKLTITASFAALSWAWNPGVFEVGAAAPAVTLDLHHDATWHYSIAVEVPNYGLTVRPGAVLEAAGVPLPIPDLREQRTARVELDNGTLLFREGAAA